MNRTLLQKVFHKGHEVIPAFLVRLGACFRRTYLPLLLGKMGKGIFIFKDVQFRDPRNVFVGDHCRIGPHCVLDACAGGHIEMGEHVVIRHGVTVDAGEKGVVKLGNGVGIGPGSYLRASTHIYDDPSKSYRAMGHKPGTITLEDDVWLAGSVCVRPDTHLEKGCIVMIGSVISGHFEAYSIIDGNPGRVVGKRGGPC